MNASQTNGLVLFLVGLLGLSLCLVVFNKTLLEHQSLLDVLFAHAAETIIVPGDAFGGALSVVVDATFQSVNNGLSFRGEHFPHAGCLTHLLLLLLQLQLVEIVHRRLVVTVRVVGTLHQAACATHRTGGALLGLPGQKPPGLHTAP